MVRRNSCTSAIARKNLILIVSFELSTTTLIPSVCKRNWVLVDQTTNLDEVEACQASNWNSLCHEE